MPSTPFLHELKPFSAAPFSCFVLPALLRFRVRPSALLLLIFTHTRISGHSLQVDIRCSGIHSTLYPLLFGLSLIIKALCRSFLFAEFPLTVVACSAGLLLRWLFRWQSGHRNPLRFNFSVRLPSGVPPSSSPRTHSPLKALRFLRLVLVVFLSSATPCHVIRVTRK